MGVITVRGLDARPAEGLLSITPLYKHSLGVFGPTPICKKKSVNKQTSAKKRPPGLGWCREMWKKINVRGLDAQPAEGTTLNTHIL